MAAIHWSSSSEPWATWLAGDALSFETQAVTMALQMSLSSGGSCSVPAEPPSATRAPGRATSRVPGPKPGRIGKRKSRAKKREPACISVDQENFMAMVQKMTGARLAGAAVGPVIKPVPRRQSFLMPGASLDGPALSLDRAGPAGSVGPGEDEYWFDVDSFLGIPMLESCGFDG